MATELENFYATCEHRRPGRILYYADFVEDLHKRIVEQIGMQNIAEHYGMVQPCQIDLPLTVDSQPLDFSPYWANEILPQGTTINADGVAMVPSGFYHFWGYVSPLRNAKDIRDLETYPMSDYRNADDSDLKRQVEQAHKEGKITRGWVGHMYETAWQIRGYEQFLMDMLDQPAWAECLLDRIAEERNFARAIAFARAGVDWIACGDDVANQKSMMFAPQTWRKMMLNRWRKVWQAVKEINPNAKIWYHSDGNIIDIVGDLIEAGVDILNPVQPECLDVDAIYKRYGSKLTFDGGIGTQSTMPWGTSTDVRARVKDLIDKYGRNGGLIISPTHVLEPEVPIENVDALCSACREYGLVAVPAV
jgi:uroporphyrinogen decarboxylase